MFIFWHWNWPAYAQNQHFANCIGALSFPVAEEAKWRHGSYKFQLPRILISFSVLAPTLQKLPTTWNSQSAHPTHLTLSGGTLNGGKLQRIQFTYVTIGALSMFYLLTFLHGVF